MNKYLIYDIKETFCRYFVVAIHNKMNLTAFTDYLASSDYLRNIENGNLIEISDISVEEGYHSIVGNNIAKDDSFGIYNDAYWCGYCYFELFLMLRKPFSYLFLKLPLEKMLDLYNVYHEMDISQLVDYFHDKEKDVDMSVFATMNATRKFSFSLVFKITVACLMASIFKIDCSISWSSIRCPFNFTISSVRPQITISPLSVL